jgi:hypothetical protein
MRRFLSLLLLPALSLTALAADPPKPDAPPQHQTRMTGEQHFIRANLAHDGHLTLEEAKGGYTVVAKHFEDIDMDHKGYVTENDIRAWRVMRKAAHRLAQPPEDKLRPRAAFQRAYPDIRTINAPARQTMAASAGFPSTGQ